MWSKFKHNIYLLKCKNCKKYIEILKFGKELIKTKTYKGKIYCNDCYKKLGYDKKELVFIFKGEQ